MDIPMERNRPLALIALPLRLRDFGPAVLDGLVPFIHAAPLQIQIGIKTVLFAMLTTNLRCSRGWPGQARP